MDGLLRLGLDISDLHGQGYDSGTNMAGRANGLQERMLKENLKTLYFHCISHQLNLVCQDACTKLPMVSHMISIVNKIVRLSVHGLLPCKRPLKNQQQLSFSHCAARNEYYAKIALMHF